MALGVVVTGGGGVLGQQVVQCLQLAGHSVEGYGRRVEKGLKGIWDIATQESPVPDITPEVVIHAAAKVGSYQESLFEAQPLFDVNVGGTLRVAQWCARHSVKHLILISGAIVYGTWGNEPRTETDIVTPWTAGTYAVSKWCSEQVAALVKQAGCRLSVLRLSSLYGMGYNRGLIQQLLKEGLQNGSIYLRAPFDDAFDLLHVTDAARTIGNAIGTRRDGMWNIGGGRVVTIRQLAEVCARHVNAMVRLSGEHSERERRILNWVDDRKARKELCHMNEVTLDFAVNEIANSLR